MSYLEVNGTHFPTILPGNSDYVAMYFYTEWSVHPGASGTCQNTEHPLSQTWQR